MVFILFNLSAVLTQIDSANWDEVQGNVIDAREVDDCSGSGVDGDSSCSHYTYVSVAYAYEGQNYTTKDYSVLSDDWMETEGYRLDKARSHCMSIRTNPRRPSTSKDGTAFWKVCMSCFSSLESSSAVISSCSSPFGSSTPKFNVLQESKPHALVAL